MLRIVVALSLPGVASKLPALKRVRKPTIWSVKIAELKTNGTITKDIEEWATVVRFIGNDAAHPNVQGVTKDDAEDCLRLAEQFLHVIFVAPAVAKARRGARGK